MWNPVSYGYHGPIDGSGVLPDSSLLERLAFGDTSMNSVDVDERPMARWKSWVTIAGIVLLAEFAVLIALGILVLATDAIPRSLGMALIRAFPILMVITTVAISKFKPGWRMTLEASARLREARGKRNNRRRSR